MNETAAEGCTRLATCGISAAYNLHLVYRRIPSSNGPYRILFYLAWVTIIGMEGAKINGIQGNIAFALYLFCTGAVYLLGGNLLYKNVHRGG